MATSEISASIIDYIAACAQIPLSLRDLAGYDDSGTRRRHLPLIREALDLKPYGPPARKAFLRAMVEAVRTKDDLADLINVALEELVRCRFELPAFGAWTALPITSVLSSHTASIAKCSVVFLPRPAQRWMPCSSSSPPPSDPPGRTSNAIRPVRH